jgi:hypothetical protein
MTTPAAAAADEEVQRVGWVVVDEDALAGEQCRGLARRGLLKHLPPGSVYCSAT